MRGTSESPFTPENLRRSTFFTRAAVRPCSVWVSVLLALAMQLTPASLQACVHPPPQPPSIILMPQPPDCVKIIVCDFITFGAGPGNFCACALNAVGPITLVKSAGFFVGPVTNLTALPGFNFVPNPNPAIFFSMFQPGNWNGYFSQVTQLVPPEVPVKIVFEVQLAPGATLQNLANALSSGGFIIGTDEAQPTGFPNGGLHTAILPAGPITIMEPTTPPVITDFNPQTGGEGTLITINGTGFGNNPDNLCAIIKSPQGRFIDIEVLTATPTQIVARLSTIPPELMGQPLQLALGVGEGDRVPLCPAPAFEDVQVAPDNWIWTGEQAGMTTAPGFFLTQANFGPTMLCNFHSGPPMGSTLMVILDKDWGVGSRYCISARVHAQGTGADTRIGPATFTGVGNRFKCAMAICDLLVKSFAAASPPINIICTVTTNAGNAKITISLPGNVPIDGGNIDIVQKEPPPVVVGYWDLENRGLWRKEVRKREIARWYRHYEWRTESRIWFEKRAEGVWITRQALSSFTSKTHCIYRFPDGRVWTIWRTFSLADVRRFRAHHRFWWPGRVNPQIPVDDPAGNRIAMSVDEVEVVLPMTPEDPNPATPGINEAVMIIDDLGIQRLQGMPGFEQMPDIAANPNGFQFAGTAQSTAQLPSAADRILETLMPPMPGMAQLQPGVIIQWLVDANGNVLVDHDGDTWPDPLTSPHVLGGQRHQGLIAPATGVEDTELEVDTGNNQLQLHCWELDPNGEVVGAMPGEVVIGPPIDLDGDGLADNAEGAPAPMDPTMRDVTVTPNFPPGTGVQIQEVLNPGKPVDIAVVEEGPPSVAELAAMNANLQAQLGPGFVPLQGPFTLCIKRISVRKFWGIDRRYVFDTWLHHWIWRHRHHITLTRKANRVWITKVGVDQFSSSHHHHHAGQPPTWSMFDLTHVRFMRLCYRVIVPRPNELLLKIDQMHVVVPADPLNPNSDLMLLSTVGDENELFQQVPPAVRAGLQPDPLDAMAVDGVVVEPIDPVTGALDIGVGGTGVFGNRPLEARPMAPLTLVGNEDDPNAPLGNQLQLYCWQLNPNGTIAHEMHSFTGPLGPQTLALAVSATPALPHFEDENGNPMDNPTMFVTSLMGADNVLHHIIQPNGDIQLSWEGAGQLEQAHDVTGTWSDYPGGNLSPVPVDPNLDRQFFRVRR